jgi:hypothetical protein
VFITQDSPLLPSGEPGVQKPSAREGKSGQTQKIRNESPNQNFPLAAAV